MLLATLFLAATAHADCMSGSLSVWPASGAHLPASGQVVLQAYGTDRARLQGLKPGDLALVRGDERIPLRVETTLHGSFLDDQAVLVPERAPDAGTWTFEMSGEPLTLWTGSAHEPVTWSFVAPDPEPPTWAGTPEIGAKGREFFGCGPVISVAIAVPTRDAVWVEATVRPPKGAGTTVRYPVQEGRIEVGHGMCSGLIELDEGVRYTVELVPIGGDGRRAPTSKLVEFVAP